ncbi:MAG: rRNA pseudouridine synthase [Bacteroidetes bacterium]|nr:rRNA pseudouridine synthase [Bacteroidota bacterium]
MAPQKENSRGKKFQNRQPGEKRLRKSGHAPIKPKKSFGDNPFRSEEKKPFRSSRPAGRDFKAPVGPRGGKTFRPKREEGGFNPEERHTSRPPYKKPFESYGRKPFKREGPGDNRFNNDNRKSSLPPFKRNNDFGGGYKKEGNNTRIGSGRIFSRDERPTGTGPRKPFEREGKSAYGKRSMYGGDKSSGRKTAEGAERPVRGKRPAFGDERPATRTARKPFDREEKPTRGKRPAFGEDKPATRKPGKFSKNRPSAHVKSTRKGAEKNYKGSRRTHESTGRDLENANLLTGEEVRLNRYIANSGICSRREADVMIEQGLVQLNGNVVTELGQKVKPGDEVKVDGRRVTPEKPVYILLNKPKGYITSTNDPDGRATVLDLIDLPGKERIYPIGRLDRNTTGVLMLTNDGELAQKLMHPSFEIKKVYRVTLDNKPSKDHMLAWVTGIELEDGFMAFEQCGFVEKEDENTLGVEIHSGRNRIVRRMFEHFGYEVKNLDRVLLGEFDHLKLGRGKWRFLNEKEQRYVERIKRSNAPKRKK